MKKPDVIDAERFAKFTIWDALDTEEKRASRIVLRQRFKRFKPPPETLPPLESTEEIADIMCQAQDVAR